MDVSRLLVGLAMLALGAAYLGLAERREGRSRLGTKAEARRRTIRMVCGVVLVLIGLLEIADAVL